MGAASEATQAPQTSPIETPLPTATHTPTPTPTPVPPPEGAWLQYWNSNIIAEAMLDREGYLWARGSGSTVRWDPAEGTYQEFGVEQGLPANTANAMFVGPEGRIWLSIDGYGLWRFDDPDWMSYLEVGEIEGTHLYAHAIGKDGMLWVCTDEGFANFDDEEWYAIHQEGGLDPGLCSHMTVGHDGSLYALGELGLAVVTNEQIEFLEFDVDIDYDDPLAAVTAPNGDLWIAWGKDHVLTFDVSEQIWMGDRRRPTAFALASDGQPWIIDYGGGPLQPNDLQTYEYGPHAIGDILSGEELELVVGYHWHLPFYEETPDRMYLLYPGVNREMWVTSAEGLLLIRGESFELFPSDERPRNMVPFGRGKAYLVLADGIGVFEGGEIVSKLSVESPLQSNSVNDLAVDPQGRLWIGYYSGVQTFDGSEWTTHDLPYTAAYDLDIAPNGDIWVSAGYGGFSRWDGTAWQPFDRGEIEGLPEARVDVIAVGDDGTVWAGFDESGIAAFDDESWTYFAFPEDRIPEDIHEIAVDPAGRVLVCADAAIYILENGSWKVEDVGVEIEVLLVGPDGALWAGTRNDGLYVGEVENLVLSDYPQETVRDLALSPDGSIWAASRNGAWRYDGYEWFPYTVEDGLRANSVRAIAAGPDGTIWFGGSGLTRFGPDG
jgi:hypothetical protein